MLTRALAVAATLALTAAAPAAGAPVLTADRACYPMDRDQHIRLFGSGFAAGSDIVVLVTGLHAGVTWSETATPIGGVTVTLPVPYLEEVGYPDSWREQVTATAVDLARAHAAPPDAANALASTTFTITNWGVRVTPWEQGPPAAGHPRRMATFSIMGWTWVKDKPIYAHYLRGGKVVRTVRLAVPQGPCGDATVQMPEFPFRPVPAGTYRIQFDASKAYLKAGSEWAHFYRAVRVAPKDAVR
jgi:hypothetical protein